MLSQIKNKIDKKLLEFIEGIDKRYSLKEISPPLFKSIKSFITSNGKRLRPMLFVLGYLGFAKKEAPNLYTSALSLELLHDFMLVHDDIIDKSDLRRNQPSMHIRLKEYIRRQKNIKFSGQDLAIVVGDVIYAMAIEALLAIKENPARKEAALRKFVEATIHTGSGEFIELLYTTKDIKDITKDDIYRIYDLKTANYTFACPLAAGAILGGADPKEANKLFRYGIYFGRAFQIQDDLLGMFSEEKKTGKSSLTDLQEAKKTILIWYAYNNSPVKNKAIMKGILTKENLTRGDLMLMRDIIRSSGALDYVRKEISALINKAQKLLSSSQIKAKYKTVIQSYSQTILTL